MTLGARDGCIRELRIFNVSQLVSLRESNELRPTLPPLLVVGYNFSKNIFSIDLLKNTTSRLPLFQTGSKLIHNMGKKVRANFYATTSLNLSFLK